MEVTPDGGNKISQNVRGTVLVRQREGRVLGWCSVSHENLKPVSSILRGNGVIEVSAYCREAG